MRLLGRETSFSRNLSERRPMGEFMAAKIVHEGSYVFWELQCPDCGRPVTEHVSVPTADCEECGAHVEVEVTSRRPFVVALRRPSEARRATLTAFE